MSEPVEEWQDYEGERKLGDDFQIVWKLAKDWETRAKELEAELDRLREALEKIADGRWNGGRGRDRSLSVRDFARNALKETT